VIILTRFKDHEVRLRLVVFIQSKRILRADNSSFIECSNKKRVCSIHTGRMPVPNRSHLKDLTLDELHPVAGPEYPHVSHAVIFVHREKFLCDLGLHIRSLSIPLSPKQEKT